MGEAEGRETIVDEDEDVDVDTQIYNILLLEKKK